MVWLDTEDLSIFHDSIAFFSATNLVHNLVPRLRQISLSIIQWNMLDLC